ncbi:MAG: hypothetical protein HY791_02690 [Deltaproteobacteria bacterium]|nr:hypothetical protein [Deltaproteobacteria bacterium]
MRLALLVPLLAFACAKEEEPEPQQRTTPVPVNNQTACTSDAQCSGTKPFCGSKGVCVTCRGYNEGCTGGYVCNPEGRCGACATASCPSEKPYCALDSIGATICVECIDDTACAGGFNTSHCDPVGHKCVECVNDEHCQDGDDSCRELKACTDGICHDTACRSDSDCAAACSLPLCDNGNCGECRSDEDCPGNRRCIVSFGNAKLCSPCVMNSDCPSTHPACEDIAGLCCTEGSPTNRICIACRNNDDCLPTEVCEERSGITTCYAR